jgi:hypothetical protein
MYLQDCDAKGLGLSPASTPESGLRSVLSVENLTCSEPEEARATPHYPTRTKTREEFLWVPSSLLFALAVLFSVDLIRSFQLTVQGCPVLFICWQLSRMSRVSDLYIPVSWKRSGPFYEFELSPLLLRISVSFASLRVNCCWFRQHSHYWFQAPPGSMIIFPCITTLSFSWTDAIYSTPQNNINSLAFLVLASADKPMHCVSCLEAKIEKLKNWYRVTIK